MFLIGKLWEKVMVGGQKPALILMLPCFLILTMYLISKNNPYEDTHQYSFTEFSSLNNDAKHFLVWNTKCHMRAENAFDSTILEFVKKRKFEACSTTPLLTKVTRLSNGSSILKVEPEARKQHKNLICCWAPVVRPKPSKKLEKNFDSTVTAQSCTDFKNQVVIPPPIEIILVKCRAGNPQKEVHKNVHPILDPSKVQDHLSQKNSSASSRKLSILILGIDSVSRLNFERTMPRTGNHLSKTGWITLRGYNKIGENTYPNLMAFLTGLPVNQIFTVYNPYVPYGLDHSPFLWHSFRNAGYVTAYGEDDVDISTFNYLKFGFVDPPTHYYLRPYIVASEKFLSTKSKLKGKYCTGPELSSDRIFNYAADFTELFKSVPFFSLFWANTVSHDSMNGPSMIDERMLQRFKDLEKRGVLNDSMVVFLSDHGMRYGKMRETFIGWYEERLPFIYVWLPEWFREQNYKAYQALLINSNRLTSPYDLYETFRDVLMRAGGEAPKSSGCPSCYSLFEVVPKERGCADAGVSSHWCTCSAFKPGNASDKVTLEGVQKFLDHVEDIVKEYKNKGGKRMCEKLKLKKLLRVNEVIDFANSTSGSREIVCLVLLSPGDGKFEITVRYHGPGNFTVNDSEISRINSYWPGAACLDHGMKQYCECVD